MLRVDTRSRLARHDLDLVLLLLSRGSATRRRVLERKLEVEGPDALLDAPELPERLLAVRTIMVPSETLFFYVMVRHGLIAGGVDDRHLADYLAGVLIHFGRRDRAWRIDWHDDHQHRYLVDILADLETAQGPRRFQVMAHLGNYALWLAGLFPEYIAARRVRKGGPDLGYYDALGSRGFGMASDHHLAEPMGLDGVFRVASERFPAVRRALNEVSARVFFPRAARG